MIVTRSFIAKLFAATSLTLAAAPALAKVGDPIPLGEGASFDLQVATRLRYEVVDQANIAPEAEALTFRARLGAELALGGFRILAEGEGTAALADDYNDTLTFNGTEPFPVVADPENLELNRLQVSYMKDGTGITVGRQRINLANQRFVGSVGWRQNEQTFDAVRGQFKRGIFLADATYAISQRTIFGVDSASEYFDGDLVLLNAGIDTASLDATAFAYVLDYETRASMASETYGLSASYTRALSPALAVTLNATYASQTDTGINPVNYQADYILVEAGATYAGFTLTAGYEELGSDGGVASFQTPLATAHAFQGWADLFLTTPANGVVDYQVSLKKAVTLPAVGAVNLLVAYHKFESAFANLDYGSEWDASLGFKLGPVNLLAKFADYEADQFGNDTQKVWLQAEWGF